MSLVASKACCSCVKKDTRTVRDGFGFPCPQSVSICAGEYIGGCSETMALDSQGGLLPKLKAAGVAYEV